MLEEEKQKVLRNVKVMLWKLVIDLDEKVLKKILGKERIQKA